MSEQALRIAGMSCAACQLHVERALKAVPGVADASVNLLAHTARVNTADGLDTATLITAVRRAGYDASLPDAQSITAQPSDAVIETERGHIGLRALLSLCAGAAAMILSMPLLLATPLLAPPRLATPLARSAAGVNSGDPLLRATAHIFAPLMPAWLMHLPPEPVRWLLAALALAVMIFAAPEIYVGAWRAARHGASNMNTLVTLGTLAAFGVSLAATIAPAAFARHGLGSDVYFEAVILILAFLLCGRWLESRARRRAVSALEGFARLQASDARLLTIAPGSLAPDYTAAPETLLPLDAIEAGDIIRILPGDRMPLDGIVLAGRSSVDESMLSGEPLPVTRGPGDRVAGGTLNLDGVLIARATAVGANSTLQQMRRLLESAQAGRAPMQRLADRASAIFVPTILVLAAITFAAWAIALNTGGLHAGFARALSAAIAVLVIACPCAMGLAVPAAITVALGRAAQSGLLVKGGEALERLATVDTLAFDKTGTLTEGRPVIAAFAVAYNASFPPATLLTYAAAAERLSTHPLAQAVVQYAEREAPTFGIAVGVAVDDLRVLPGVGLTALVEGHRLALGNATLLQEARLHPAAELQPPPELAYATPLFLLLDGQPQAAFFATDELRDTAIAAVAELRQLHISPLLLTGDTLPSAEPIAQRAGITDIRAHLLPADKLQQIRALQEAGHKVAMAGDGINDAAALAQADAGLAMAAGADLAREAGDVLLLRPDLRLLPGSVRVARRTVRVMRQNLGWAMAYNAVGLPLAAGVFYPHFHILLSPIVASAAMALSSVSVLANSLRLRRMPGLPGR